MTRDDRGSILIIAAAILIILVLLFAALSEYGRYLIMREQTQTAADAAALAGASGVIRYVKIEVVTERGSEEVCEPDNDGGWDCYCVSCGTVTEVVTDTETKLIDEGKWKDYVWPPCDCGGYNYYYVILDRWVVYRKAESENAARSFFAANQPTLAEEASIKEFTIHDKQDDPFYPSVVVKAEAFMKNLWSGFLGIFPSQTKADVCAQGDTFYINPKEETKWSKPPGDACAIN